MLPPSSRHHQPKSPDARTGSVGQARTTEMPRRHCSGAPLHSAPPAAVWWRTRRSKSGWKVKPVLLGHRLGQHRSLIVAPPPKPCDMKRHRNNPAVRIIKTICPSPHHPAPHHHRKIRSFIIFELMHQRPRRIAKSRHTARPVIDRRSSKHRNC